MSTIHHASGNTNDPNSYDLTCSCGQLLGPLGRFRQNVDGWRTILCECGKVTYVQGTTIRMAENLNLSPV